MVDLDRAEFKKQVADAYEHLYDLVCLRTHPLANLVIADPAARRKEKAWRLHQILLDVINEIDPGPQAPAFSREWRRHRLMILHYVDGLDPKTVADQLGISRRHYYREHEAAVEAIASILWQRYTVQAASAEAASSSATEPPPLDRLELLRLEAARTAQGDRYTHIETVIQGVHALLQETLRQRNLDFDLALPEELPAPMIDQNLLRQVLLGLLGYLIEHTNRAAIRVEVQSTKMAILLSLFVLPPAKIRLPDEAEMQSRLAPFREMVALSESNILPVYHGHTITGFTLQLSTDSQRTVLVVDDNEDVLELFQRYLSLNDYHVVTAQTGREALELAHQIHPYAITLDLMMPDQDGWDLMQILLNQPDTRSIPIIVCSVLRQKELALLLGATAFLEKPVSDQDLLEALEALTR